MARHERQRRLAMRSIWCVARKMPRMPPYGRFHDWARTRGTMAREKLCQPAAKHSITGDDEIARRELFIERRECRDGRSGRPHGRPAARAPAGQRLDCRRRARAINTLDAYFAAPCRAAAARYLYLLRQRTPGSAVLITRVDSNVIERP